MFLKLSITGCNRSGRIGYISAEYTRRILFCRNYRCRTVNIINIARIDAPCYSKFCKPLLITDYTRNSVLTCNCSGKIAPVYGHREVLYKRRTAA